MRQDDPYLTKSRFLNGLACEKYLWLGWHEPAPYEEAEAGSPAAIGTEIGIHAHKLFPGGRPVAAQPWDHEAAIVETQSLMGDSSVPAIFEAAFEAGNIRIRVDVLERLDGDSWGLREVKSSTGQKEEHLPDIAIQLKVLQDAGLNVRSAELVHIDKEYVLGSEPIDWSRFFARVELIDDVRAIQSDIELSASSQFEILKQPKMPNIRAGKHCPEHCPYWEDCTINKPRDWIFYLPRLAREKFDELQGQGIVAISQIPQDYPLNQMQTRIREVVTTRKPYVSNTLSSELKSIAPPVHYLDFETMAPPIPLYPGTSPYNVIPFQWSLHSLDEKGKLKHQEFLANAEEDPRQVFTEYLVAALNSTDAPIVVYSSFEKTVLNAMAEHCPELADKLNAIISRLQDLLIMVRNNVYLEAFKGSFSIKNVGPALVEDFSYEELSGIKDGAAAASAYWRMCTGEIPESDFKTTQKALLEYCKNDTLAMVQVHKALLEFS